jgi:hypothetical protein
MAREYWSRRVARENACQHRELGGRDRELVKTRHERGVLSTQPEGSYGQRELVLSDTENWSGTATSEELIKNGYERALLSEVAMIIVGRTGHNISRIECKWTSATNKSECDIATLHTKSTLVVVRIGTSIDVVHD